MPDKKTNNPLQISRVRHRYIHSFHMFPPFSLFSEVGWGLEKLAPNIETSSETTTKQEFPIPCYRASSQRFDCLVILMTQAPCRPSNFLHVCPSNNTGPKFSAAPSSARCLGEDVAVVPMRWTGKCPAVDECQDFGRDVRAGPVNTCQYASIRKKQVHVFYLNGYWRIQICPSNQDNTNVQTSTTNNRHHLSQSDFNTHPNSNSKPRMQSYKQTHSCVWAQTMNSMSPPAAISLCCPGLIHW